jgi:anthranilate synthase component 2
VFRGVPSPLTATRYHSLVVDEPLPPELVRTAWTDRSGKGADELMGLRHTALPIEGVQFHPESYMTPRGNDLLANFLQTVSPDPALPR